MLTPFPSGDHPAPQHLEFEEGRLCGICLMPFEEGQQVITTDCSHIFHRGCGLPWMFQTAGAETCPTCRSYLERVYIGFYEKARENMNPEKISVLTGQHHSINKWRIIGLEYQTNEEARFSGARFCKKMFIDDSLWIIVRRIQDGRWVTNSGVKFLAHHPSIPHLTWHCNPKWLAILMSPIRIQLNICRQGDPYLNGALVPIQGITKSGRFQIEAEDFAIGTQIPHHTNQEDNLIR